MKNLDQVLKEIYGNDFSGEDSYIEPNVVVIDENGVLLFGTAFQLLRMCGPSIKNLNVLEMWEDKSHVIVKVEER